MFRTWTKQEILAVSRKVQWASTWLHRAWVWPGIVQPCRWCRQRAHSSHGEGQSGRKISAHRRERIIRADFQPGCESYEHKATQIPHTSMVACHLRVDFSLCCSHHRKTPTYQLSCMSTILHSKCSSLLFALQITMLRVIICTLQGVECLRHQWAYSCDKAKRELGYSPRSLTEGLAETLLYLKNENLIKF